MANSFRDKCVQQQKEGKKHTNCMNLPQNSTCPSSKWQLFQGDGQVHRFLSEGPTSTQGSSRARLQQVASSLTDGKASSALRVAVCSNIPTPLWGFPWAENTKQALCPEFAGRRLPPCPSKERAALLTARFEPEVAVKG